MGDVDEGFEDNSDAEGSQDNVRKFLDRGSQRLKKLGKGFKKLLKKSEEKARQAVHGFILKMNEGKADKESEQAGFGKRLAHGWEVTKAVFQHTQENLGLVDEEEVKRRADKELEEQELRKKEM